MKWQHEPKKRITVSRLGFPTPLTCNFFQSIGLNIFTNTRVHKPRYCPMYRAYPPLPYVGGKGVICLSSRITGAKKKNDASFLAGWAFREHFYTHWILGSSQLLWQMYSQVPSAKYGRDCCFSLPVLSSPRLLSSLLPSPLSFPCQCWPFYPRRQSPRFFIFPLSSVDTAPKSVSIWGFRSERAPQSRRLSFMLLS